MRKSVLEAPEDVSIYELHIRDFSASDPSVPPEHRGKYLAFTHDGGGQRALSHGMQHLSELRAAGLRVVHLLPTFDLATINEDPEARVELSSGFDRLCQKNPAVPPALCAQHGSSSIATVLAGLDPTSGEPQALLAYVRPFDAFNWGYDPFHYTVPEGSYAVEADGAARIRELRAMILALAGLDLRVALDVVYNHTNGTGLGSTSVLDKVVPGYYHRTNPESGFVEQSTCAPILPPSIG